jgi:hypothetical protein
MVDQKGSLGVIGDIFEVMAQVDCHLTKVNTIDRIIRVNKPGRKPGASQYRSMIGSLLYLTATRPDIQLSVCLCAHFQVSPRTSHRQAVKRIFRYLRHTPDFVLWYSVSSSLVLHGFLVADFAGC